MIISVASRIAGPRRGLPHSAVSIRLRQFSSLFNVLALSALVPLNAYGATRMDRGAGREQHRSVRASSDQHIQAVVLASTLARHPGACISTGTVDFPKYQSLRDFRENLVPAKVRGSALTGLYHASLMSRSNSGNQIIPERVSASPRYVSTERCPRRILELHRPVYYKQWALGGTSTISACQVVRTSVYILELSRNGWVIAAERQLKPVSQPLSEPCNPDASPNPRPGFGRLFTIL